jgi:ABC-type transport system involved in multi-copper enzyme maturation permease subunit
MASEPQGNAGSWASLLAFEWAKLRGRRITWVPFIVLALVVQIIMAAFHKIQFQHQLDLFKKSGLPIKSKEDFVNGYFVAAHGMNPTFQLLLPIFIAVASGLMVAGEAEQGTLRACLIRPLKRRRLILGKFSILLAYAWLLSIMLMVMLVVFGRLNFGHGNLYTLNVLFNNGQLGASMVPEAELPGRFLAASLISTMGMGVLASLALLISSLVETAAMAYVITLSVYFSELVLRLFPMIDWLYPYLFVTHMMRWQQCFSDFVPWGEVYVSMVHLAGYMLAFLSAAVLLFEERDIKS